MSLSSDHPDIARRSEQFVGLTRKNLAEVSGSWPLSENTPSAVAELLAESRRLFVGAAVSYDNFVASLLKALQAADLVLKLALGFDMDEQRTMGQLLKFEQTHPVLDSETREWYTEFALRFRNDLSHPKRSSAFSPGFAEPILRTCHERVAMVCVRSFQ